ncbi:MAG: SGNH/GDSL hydrolase family protein [Oscillospiraceae bacterium]|nr:SGNH/GDSL hydrolase family protein [Oscillospiraceae bacterium]
MARKLVASLLTLVFLGGFVFGSVSASAAGGVSATDFNYLAQDWAVQDGTFTRTDAGGANSTITLKTPIDGSKGFSLSFDITYPAADSSVYWQLQPAANSPWYFCRTQSSGGTVAAKGQVNVKNQWQDLFGSSQGKYPGGVHVSLTHNAGDAFMTLLMRSVTTQAVIYAVKVEDTALTNDNFFDQPLTFAVGSENHSMVSFSHIKINESDGYPDPGDVFAPKSLDTSMSNYNDALYTYTQNRQTAPYQNVLFIGDSITAGVGATSPDQGWAGIISHTITAYQAFAPTFVNKARSASVLSTSCPAYTQSARPAAMERIDKDFDKNYDLIFLAYGVNDLRGGTPPDVFEADYRNYLTQVRQKCPDATIVMLDVFAMDASGYSWDGVWGKGTPALHGEYNNIIRRLAGEFNALFVDVYGLEAERTGMLADGLHPTQLGHQLIADRVFETLARYSVYLANSVGQAKVAAPEPAAPAGSIADIVNAQVPLQLEPALRATGIDLGFFDELCYPMQFDFLNQFLALDRSGMTTAADVQKAVDVLEPQFLLPLSDSSPLSLHTYNKIVVEGDSISVGLNATAGPLGWVRQFQTLLDAAQGGSSTLINNAISGTRMASDLVNNGVTYTAPGKRIQGDVLKNDPDLLIIAYGINDLNNGETLDNFVAAYRDYLTAVRAGTRPEMDIVLVGISYMWNDQRGDQIKQWNEQIRQLANDFGAVYQDVYGSLSGAEWMLSDGVHPTDLGHRVMAARVFASLQRRVVYREVVQPAIPPATKPASGKGLPWWAFVIGGVLAVGLGVGVGLGVVKLLGGKKSEENEESAGTAETAPGNEAAEETKPVETAAVAAAAPEDSFANAPPAGEDTP